MSLPMPDMIERVMELLDISESDGNPINNLKTLAHFSPETYNQLVDQIKEAGIPERASWRHFLRNTIRYQTDTKRMGNPASIYNLDMVTIPLMTKCVEQYAPSHDEPLNSLLWRNFERKLNRLNTESKTPLSGKVSTAPQNYGIMRASILGAWVISGALEKPSHDDNGSIRRIDYDVEEKNLAYIAENFEQAYSVRYELIKRETIDRHIIALLADTDTAALQEGAL